MSALLSPSQAARLLNLHPNSVRRLAAEGKLPSQRVGWSRVFTVQDVQQFAEARRRRGNTAQAKRQPDDEGAGRTG
jgi:excisionase family DNA binding protein